MTLTSNQLAASKHPHLKRNISVYLLLCIVVGLLAGLLWHFSVKPAEYATAEDGSLVISERSLSQFFQSDVLYIFIGVIVSIAIGIICWNIFFDIGWPVAFLTLLGALVAGGTCWAFGYILGPNDFITRAAQADTGDRVPIDLTIHTVAALFVWPFAAILPTMLYSAFSKDPQDPQDPVIKSSQADDSYQSLTDMDS